MPHVPGPSFGLGAFVREDDLVAGAASRLERLGVMPAAVESAVPPEVDEVDEELPADAACEACRMPERRRSRSTCPNCDLPGGDGSAAFATSAAVGPLHLGRLTPTQGLALPLAREHAQLPLLLLRESAAVPRFVVVWWELLEELPHAFPLPGAPHVRDLLFRQPAEVKVYLRVKKDALLFHQPRD